MQKRLRHPLSTLLYTHRHIPVCVIESDEDDDTLTDSGSSAQPDHDVPSPAPPLGEDVPTEAAPEQPPVLDAPSGAEIRARYTLSHGGMKCLPKIFAQLL